MGKYSHKRVKSTAAKNYTDYLQMRAEMESQGIELVSPMSKEQFQDFYDRLKIAKKQGEIKAQPWAELKKRERYITSVKVARNLMKAQKAQIVEEYQARINSLTDQKKIQELTAEMKRKSKEITIGSIYKQSSQELASAFEYIEQNKQSGLFGGDYE